MERLHPRVPWFRYLSTYRIRLVAQVSWLWPIQYRVKRLRNRRRAGKGISIAWSASYDTEIKNLAKNIKNVALGN